VEKMSVRKAGGAKNALLHRGSVPGLLPQAIDQLVDGFRFHVETDIETRIEGYAEITAHFFQHPGKFGKHAAAEARVVTNERLGTLRDREQHQDRRAVLGIEHQRLGTRGER